MLVRKRASEDADLTAKPSTKYGTINVPVQSLVIKDLTNWDVTVFALIFWNVYLSRKLLYPFSKEFAPFYDVPISSFSFVLAAFDVGGSLSVFLTLVPSFHHIRIRLLMFLLIFALSALYFLASFCYELQLIFVVRMGMGFFANTTSSELRGIMSVFSRASGSNTDNSIPQNGTINTKINNELNELNEMTESEKKLASQIMLVETAWSSSSAGWIVIGVILHRLGVLYVWNFCALCALITALCCYFLPRFTVSDILNRNNSNKSKIVHNGQSMNTKETPGIQSVDSEMNISPQKSNDIDHDTIWNQYHLHWFILGQFIEMSAYCAFMATFGPFMQQKYGLNSEQLGIQTVFVSVAEGVALIVASLTAKCKTNLWRAIMSSSVTVIIGFVFSIILWTGEMPIVIMWIMLFAYSGIMENVHLNGIVCVLEMAPHGLESRCSLLSQSAISVASIIGLIIGPHLVIWYGFTVMMTILLVAQLVAVLLWLVAKRVFHAAKYTIID